MGNVARIWGRLVGRVHSDPCECARASFLQPDARNPASVHVRLPARVARPVDGGSAVENPFWRRCDGAHVGGGWNNLKNVSGGLCDLADVEGTIERIVTFICAGMRAPLAPRAESELAKSMGHLLKRLILLSAVPLLLSAQPLDLSMKQAVDMALAPDGNARVQLVQEAVKQAQSRNAQARAALLPNLDASVSEQNQTRNLAAMGIKIQLPIPGFQFPELAGPYTLFDARASVTQSVFDFSAIRRYPGFPDRRRSGQSGTVTPPGMKSPARCRCSIWPRCVPRPAPTPRKPMSAWPNRWRNWPPIKKPPVPAPASR